MNQIKSEKSSFVNHSKLTASTIKWFAIVCMLADHIGWGFFPVLSPIGVVLHILGRITAPCMCFFIAEGYMHTRNIKNYLLRLGIFAIIPWPCYTFFAKGQITFSFGSLGMIWSLFFSLLVVCALDRIKQQGLKILAVVGCMAATLLGDWPIFSVIYTLIFWNRRGNFPKLAAEFSIASVFMALSALFTTTPRFFFVQMCVLLALIPLFYYNGQRGGESHPALNKWFFYIFYPAHLFLLGFLKCWIF